MKTLILTRHAKSSWKTPSPDHDRGLKKRGMRDAKMMGEYLRAVGIAPDIVLSSDARRAKKTARKIYEKAGMDGVPLIFERKLYDIDSDSMCRYIQSLSDDYDSVMIVGHNPAISECALEYSANDIFGWIPTTGVAILKFESEGWRDILVETIVESTLLTPKTIGSGESRGG